MKNAQNQTNQQQQHTEIADNDLLLAIYGSQSFLKIYQALEIGKIKFSFVPKDNPKDSIDCYINADDFASDLIPLINSEELRKLAYSSLQKQQKENAKYADEIWESRTGINSNGETEVIRKFTIQPGLKQPYLFRASQGDRSITVGCAWRDIKLLAYRWSFLEKDWNQKMSEKYCLKAMENSYHSKHNAEQVAKQEAEESMGELPVNANNAVAVEKPTSEVGDYGISSEMKSTEIPVEDSLPVEKPEPAKKPEPKPEAKAKDTITVKIVTPILDMQKGGKAFQGMNSKNERINIVIRQDRLDKADADIKRIVDEASKLGNKITVEIGERGKDRIYVA